MLARGNSDFDGRRPYWYDQGLARENSGGSHGDSDCVHLSAHPPS